MKMIYDLIIIGTGPAGMCAAVYAGRYKLKTLVFGTLIGGQAGEAWEICNFPGYKKIKGYELVTNMKEQVLKLGVEIKPKLITEIKKSKEIFSCFSKMFLCVGIKIAIFILPFPHFETRGVVSSTNPSIL